MNHFFVDTNILLDLLGQREPFGAAAAQLLERAVHQETTLHVSALSFSHIDYILRKAMPAPERLYKMARLASVLTIVTVDQTVVENALYAGFPDFEDGLQYCAALTVPGIEAIITRDPKGFASGVLPVLTPPEALVRLGG
jgi:predicted nucleic acid-binding protein